MIYLALGFFFFHFNNAHSHPIQPVSQNLQSLLDSIRMRSNYTIPALGGTILKDGQITSAISGYRKYGNPTVALTTDPFHLASCTKAMTATLVAIFVERHFLSYSSPLSEIFPDLEIQPQFKTVTVGDLLTHHSGITGDEQGYDGGRLWARLLDPKLSAKEGRMIATKAVLTEKVSTLPLVKSAGSVHAFEYSNWNYMILGTILERASHSTWEDMTIKEIFIPLQMESCGFGNFGDATLPNPDAPMNHTSEYDDPNPKPTPAGFVDLPLSVGPAGTVYCNMKDWARFLQFQLDGLSSKKTPLLKQETFALMNSSPYPANPDGGKYTYGAWGRSPDGLQYNHAGSDPGNAVDATLIPGRNTAVLSVTNWGAPIAQEATFQVTENILSVLFQN